MIKQNKIKTILVIISLICLLPFSSTAGDTKEVNSSDVNHIVGKTLKITQVDFKGLNLPATNHFEIEFTDTEKCYILVNGKKLERVWRYNERRNTIDIKDTFEGSIKQFVLFKEGSNISMLQRVNEEELHRMITEALR